MTEEDAIELQQPLGCTDEGVNTSTSSKENIAYLHGNEQDQADMYRLGKNQKLDVSWNITEITGYA